LVSVCRCETLAAPSQNRTEIMVGDMADNEKLPFHELSAISQAALANAYWAMDYYFDSLRKTISAIPSGGSVFGEQMKAYAEKNVSLMQEFSRQLRQVKSLQEISSIQTKFMQDALQAFEEQVESTGYAFKKTVTDVSKKV
jgi:hypothetical protein